MPDKMTRGRVELIRLRVRGPFPSDGLRGRRLVFASDLHMGRRPGRAHREAAAIIRELDPELVLLGGDLVNSPRGWPIFAEWRKSLGPIPVFAVPGNWEYKRGGGLGETDDRLRQSGVELLRNRVIRPGDDFPAVIAGFDDPRRGRPDPEAVREQIRAMASPDLLVLGVCHSPDLLLAAPRGVDLLLCGHTHGGQICLPGRRALVTSTRQGRRMAYGLHSPGSPRYVYITSGVGTTYLPVRINCPAEVVCLELVGGQPVLTVRMEKAR